jgi:hypothetical protein
VTAIGAAGGFGVKNNDRSSSGGFDPSFGSSVYARFHFKKGEEVYMVIGQIGESACAKVRVICCSAIFRTLRIHEGCLA